MYVSVDPFQEAFLASDLTANDVAHRLGWREVGCRRWTAVDSHRVLRVLGLKPYHDSRGMRYRQRLQYQTALVLAEALDLDPHEVGL